MKDLNSLPKATKAVFLELSKIKAVNEYTFVGGSALSVYLNHRESEDIDYLNPRYKVRLTDIQKHFEKRVLEYLKNE